MSDETEEQELVSGEDSASQDEESTESTGIDGNEDLQRAVLALYRQCCQDDRYARLIEVKDVKQAELYWQGQQYNWWSSTDMKWNLPTQAPGYGDTDVDDMPRYEFVTNIYQARGLMVIAAIAGAPPRVRFFPTDADNDDDIQTGEGRSKLAKLIQRWNPPQKLLQKEAYHAWTGGFILWWSRYVPNGEKYGYDSNPVVNEGSEDVEDTISCPKCGWSAPAQEAHPPVPCPQCGAPLTEENVTQEEPISVPEDGGTEDIPKGRQVISVFGALNVKRPQHTDEQSEWHYLGLEEEVHYCKLRAAHSDKADKIKPGAHGGGEDAYERNARLSVSENTRMSVQTGSGTASLVTHARVWLRPTAFWMCDNQAHREALLEAFPRGGLFEFAGDIYLDSEAISMDDALVSCHAMPGRGQHRPAVGSATISVQDRLNSLSNISMETYEYGIPITYRDENTFSSDADSEQRAAPGLEVGVVLGPGEDINDKILQTRADSVSPDMHEHMMELFGPVADQISGAYPALSGAGEGAPETLGQQSMQRDQAMGRMGIFYVNLKQAHADLMTVSCRDYEQHADGIVKIPVFGQSGDFESETVDITALEGDAEAYPEGDENFPELWNQQRSTMERIMASPWGAELIKDMGNAELLLRMSGIPDLKIPGIDSWRKQLKEIAQLTKMPEGDDMLSGIAPMVQVDPVNDDNVVEEACCGWWLNSEQGQKLKLKNEIGWEAVSQHRAKHKSAIPQQPPPQKPLSETFTANYKDMPPEAQAQILEQMGIHVAPKDFLVQAALNKTANTPHQPGPLHDPTHPPLAPPHSPAPGNMPPPTGALQPPVNAVGG